MSSVLGIKKIKDSKNVKELQSQVLFHKRTFCSHSPEQVILNISKAGYYSVHYLYPGCILS